MQQPSTSPQLTDSQQRLLPARADVQSYREHGFWISPVIIPDDVLDAAERGMQRYYAGDLDSTGIHPAGWAPEVGTGLRKNDYSSLCVDELAALVRHPMIGATAAALSGAAGIRLWHDQLLYKPSDDGDGKVNVGWHTDRQYWESCTSTEMLTAWVAFHDVDPEGGSVGFLDRSHTWDVTGLDFFSQDLAGLEDSIRAQGFSFDLRATTMKRGQVSFHHCRTVHGSGANRSGAPRRSLAIHLQPTDNRPLVRADGQVDPHTNTRLARQTDGLPDFGEERLFPLLWGR
ncbi:phytanoyl-CoA dioxygenase family protein [Microlunatus speluncae]|uniref:phytanoyl-CoA dioxygenase family protein n=1 Tax=Microlunatus speluncae TaxID=2594267 RepID=UPI0012666BEB|nr:phytanoyl-CoA dioxygenase family protein [Microlunatus speluncae]